MKPDLRRFLLLLAPGVALGLWLGLGAFLLRATLDPAQRATVVAAIGPLIASHGMLVLGWWLIAAALMAWGAHRLHDSHVAAAARLADATRVLTGDPAAPDPTGFDRSPLRALAAAITALAARRRALHHEMAQLVADASRDVAQQRDQLGALMAELDQSVVVCARDGRVLLYNERARQLFRRLSPAPPGMAGAELIGLGRSIHGVIDPALIAHAVETIEHRLTRGEPPSARFVTSTPVGHLLRVNLAPVRPAGEETGLSGFVLLFDDITDAYEADTQRDRQSLALTESSRASLANIQAALDMLDYPDLDAAARGRFQTVVRDEVTSLGARLTRFAASASDGLMTRWPLQEMRGADLLAAAQRRIAADHGQTLALELSDPALWLNIDSFALIEALACLAEQLLRTGASPRLRLSRAENRAHLDLLWSSDTTSPDTARDWQTAPMRATGPAPLSPRDVAERHGGELWIEQDRGAHLAFFRFLLPLAASEPAPLPMPPQGGRPEYYDFDLFATGPASRAFDQRLLSEIACTVFDTETTGLAPAQGDEILQIGAIRLVHGKLLRGECFDQLIDPNRPIPEASTRIHGIDHAAVRGKPGLDAVLPAFHAFVGDTVLVGHNVAFDMRFLALRQASSGVTFDQPLLDTMLLSSLTHPSEPSHSLESIATRLGLAPPSGRHTALGDAITTAEVFLKLLPLLDQRGIRTLSQARDAARLSYYARLRY